MGWGDALETPQATLEERERMVDKMEFKDSSRPEHAVIPGSTAFFTRKQIAQMLPVYLGFEQVKTPMFTRVGEMRSTHEMEMASEGQKF